MSGAIDRRVMLLGLLIFAILAVLAFMQLLSQLGQTQVSTTSLGLKTAADQYNYNIDAPGEYFILNTQGQVVMAQRNIPQQIPTPDARLGQPPGHVQNHADGSIRLAAWYTALNAWLLGNGPNKCWGWEDGAGNHIKNGPTLAQFDIQVPLIDGGFTSGILLVLQPEGYWSKSTAIPRGSPTNGMKESFTIEIPCPPGPPGMSLAQ